jgi:iron complex outermembrane receptor protein
MVGKIHLLTATAAFALLSANPALAEEPKSSYGLEEITVTARKIEENLQTAPVSVTVVTNKILNDLTMTNIGDIQAITPNLQYTSGFSGSSAGANFFIRGIGQLDFLSTSDPGVATFVDGVYLARTVGSAIDTADIERIEVLKGPQGTLFGKNTIGGAINITTRKPDSELRGMVEATVGNYGRVDGRFMANVPISDSFFVKLSGVTRTNDGFQTRVVDGEKLGDDDTVAGSLQARWVASEDLEIILAVDGTRRRANIAAHTATQVSPGALSGVWESLTGVDGLSFQPSSNPRKVSTTGIRPSDELDVIGTSLTVNYDLGDMDLKSITAYREMEADTGTDFDGTQIQLNDQLVHQEQEQFSQEFQLSQTTDQFKWVVGAYYMKEDVLEEIQNNFVLFYLPPSGAPIGKGPLSTTDLSTDNFAVFGQGSYNLTDEFSVTAGVRYTYEKKDAAISGPFGLGTLGAPLDVANKESWNNISPRIGVEYQPSEDLLLYASFTRGFKSGSFNGRPDRNEFDPFDPEKVSAYEVGFKSEFADNRVRLNGAAFLTQYNEVQLVSVLSDSNGQPYFPVANAGDAEVKGFELELTAVPAEGLNVYANIGVTDEKWTEIKPIAIIDENTRLPFMSHFTGVFGGDYAVPVANFGSVTFGANYTYRSAFYVDTGNVEALRQKGYGLLDARIIFEPEDGNWQFKIWGKNLTDKTYITWAQDLAALGLNATSFYGRPAEFGATFSVNL